MYDVLADLVVLIHFLFILFVVFGALLTLRYPSFVYLHLPALAWGSATEFFGIICPLTYLENHWREAAGGAAIETTFIEHYLVPVVYPPALSREIQLLLGVLLVSFNAILYYRIWRRNRTTEEETRDAGKH